MIIFHRGNRKLQWSEVLVVAFAILLAFVFACGHGGSAENSTTETSGTDRPAVRPPAKAADSGPPAVAEREGWSLDLADKEVPDRAATGFIRNKPFQVDKAEMSIGILSIQQGTEFIADYSIKIFTFTEMNEIEGKTFNIGKDAPGFEVPHVHMRWKPERAGVTDTEVFMKGYAMKLEFGKKADGKLPGTIYLCLPDKHKSMVAGTFEAVLD